MKEESDADAVISLFSHNYRKPTGNDKYLIREAKEDRCGEANVYNNKEGLDTGNKCFGFNKTERAIIHWRRKVFRRLSRPAKNNHKTL